MVYMHKCRSNRVGDVLLVVAIYGQSLYVINLVVEHIARLMNGKWGRLQVFEYVYICKCGQGI